jgi:hypothetical protein
MPWPHPSRRHLLLALALIACGAPPAQAPVPYGVEIFAEDTVVARLTVTVTGDLQVTVRGDEFQVLPDRSFRVATPATLTLSRGVGTATITSVDSITRLAVVRAGTPQDSVDAATVAGTVVKLTRLGFGDFRLTAERP